MARIHHYGLYDRPARGAKEVSYEERQLLGLKDNDLQMICDIITSSLT